MHRLHDKARRTAFEQEAASSFQTSYLAIRFTDKHPKSLPRCSLVWESEKEGQPQVFLLFQGASCIQLCTHAHTSPAPRPGHSCGCHTFLTGVTSLKTTTASSRQLPTQTVSQISPGCQLPSRSGFSTLLSSLGGAPAFFQLLLTMIPFLHVTPSSHQKLAYHDPKWSLLQSPQFQSPISHDSTAGGVNLGVASLTSTSITHKLTFNPPWAPRMRENSASAFQKGNCSSQSWLVFFPDSGLPVAHGFECWRSKLRKIELHPTKTQEVKNKQTKPWYTRQAQKLEVFAGSAYCHTSRPGRQAFFHFAGKPPQSTVSGNICH